MPILTRNLAILIAMQAFSMTAAPLVILVGGLVGARIAPSPDLATLPIAILVVASALGTVPASMIMRRIGRRLGFLLGNAVALVGTLIGALALMNAHFSGFLLATACLGFNMAFINQYRFAAMESVEESRHGQAVSLLLLGGIFAALVGPEAGALGEHLLSQPYAGSFLLLTGLLSVSTVLILFGYHDTAVVEAAVHDTDGRHWPALLSQPLLWLALMAGAVSYGVMSLVMTAAPVSMHEMDHHSLGITKTAIQAHILAMFVPSLATGWLIRRFGAIQLLLGGLVLYAVMITAGLSGRTAGHYGLTLILLGIGWNFMFVAGTSLLPQTYKGAERFRVQALNDFVVFGTQAGAALGAGWLLFQLGWFPLLWATVPAVGVLGLLTVWTRRPALRPIRAVNR